MLMRDVVVVVPGKPLNTSCSPTAPCADHMLCQGPEGGATCVCAPGHVPDTNATCGQYAFRTPSVERMNYQQHVWTVWASSI